MEAVAQKTPRAILYTRVSTEEQAESGTSLSSQLEECKKKALEIGATLAGHYEDAGVSGAYYLTRPGIQCALKDLEAGIADVLIIANLSRFSRDREHQSAIKKRVAAAGSRLVFCDMNYEDTPEGDLAFGIMGTFADYERQVIRTRTMKGRRKRAVEDGVQPARARSPYGYRVVTKNDVLTGAYPPGTVGTYQVIEEQARWIEGMFTRYAAGDSLREVARWLHRNGVPLPRGGAFWRPGVLERILEHPVYKGCPVYGRFESRSDEARIQHGNKVRFFRLGPAEKHVPLLAAALVDENTWNACNVRLKEAQKLFSGNPTRKFMLSGMAKCPTCGGGLRGKRHNKSPVNYSYSCKMAYGNSITEEAPERSTCARRCYPGKDLEAMVVEAVEYVAAQPECVKAAVEAYLESCRQEQPQGDRERLVRELRSLEAKERATVEAQIAGIQAGISPVHYSAVLQDVAARRSALQEEIDRTAGPSLNVAAPQKTADLVLSFLKDVRVALTSPELTPCERHDLLAGVVEKIVPGEAAAMVALRPIYEGDETVSNILMFGDGAWLPERTDEQDSRLSEWLSGITGRSLAIVECGAGTAIPTIRRVTEGLVRRFDARAIRINVREPEGPDGIVPISMGALETLRGIDEAMG